MSETGEQELKTRAEMLARIPSDQRFQWRLTPMPGRLLLASTVGGSLIAMKDIFKGIGEEMGERTVVCVLDAKFDADGAICFELVVSPAEKEAK